MKPTLTDCLQSIIDARDDWSESERRVLMEIAETLEDIETDAIEVVCDDPLHKREPVSVADLRGVYETGARGNSGWRTNPYPERP